MVMIDALKKIVRPRAVPQTEKRAEAGSDTQAKYKPAPERPWRKGWKRKQSDTNLIIY
jgi:hypothetical protein